MVLAEARHKLRTAVVSKITGTAVRLAADCLEPQVVNAAVALGVCGICGSVLMFIGDVLLYSSAAWGLSGSDYFEQVDPVGGQPELLSASVMGTASQPRLIMGGVLGPLAEIFYLLGCLQMLLPSLPPKASEWCLSRCMWGLLACGGHVSAIIVVGAYHAAFAYTGFIASAFDGSAPGGSSGQVRLLRTSSLDE